MAAMNAPFAAGTPPSPSFPAFFRTTSVCSAFETQLYPTGVTPARAPIAPAMYSLSAGSHT